jgi:hypothetical protein
MLGSTTGNMTEAMVLSAFQQRRFDVLVPFGDGHPYDLAVHLKGPEFLRVQCKTARPQGGCLVFNARSTDHGRGPQSYVGLADIFGVYFPPSQAVYLVPIDGVANFEGRLRLESTRNNQRRGIRMAADFGIDRWSAESLHEVAAKGRVAPELAQAIA